MASNGIAKIGNTIQSSRSECVHWFMTFNNYEKHGYSGIKVYEILKNLVKKLVMQEEVGECGTPHLQGSMTFKKKIRLSALKKVICDQVNWQQTNNVEAASNYCMKELTRNGKQWVVGMPVQIKILDTLRPFQCEIQTAMV